MLELGRVRGSGAISSSGWLRPISQGDATEICGKGYPKRQLANGTVLDRELYPKDWTVCLAGIVRHKFEKTVQLINILG